MNKIVVVDYGMGNLRSVAQALRAVAPEANVVISGEVADIDSADRIVLPGQGAMPDCMRSLRESGVQDALMAASRNKPLMGVCIGEQMLFEHSEEGNVAGLGVFAGEVRRFPDEKMVDRDGLRLKVPHMGWNEVQQKSHALWADIADASRFYFVHSYCVQPADTSLVMGTTDYGLPFTCAVGRDNIFAVQCHPEKSARDGLQLLKNFVEWRL